MGWTFYNSSGQKLNTRSSSITNLDIDGATDIGAAIVDADLFIIDDNASGTNRKTAASRIVTYVGADTDTRSGVAKLWCKWTNHTASGNQIAGSYNYTSVVDGGAVGDSDHVIATDFSGTVYALVTASESNGTVTIVNSIATGTFTTITVSNTDGAAIDHTLNYVAGFGDQ
jgi:hypothetical protein